MGSRRTSSRSSRWIPSTRKGSGTRSRRGSWGAPLVEPAFRPPSATPLVGRRGELQAIRELWDQVAATNQPRLITLLGPPGIGKTRVARVVTDELERSGASGPVGPQPAVRGADAVPRRLGDGGAGGRDLRGRSSGRGAGQARGPGRRPAPRRRGHRRDEASLVADGSRARRPDRRSGPPPVRRAPRHRGAGRPDPPGARVRGRVLGRRAVARARGLPGRPRAGPSGAVPRARPSRAPPATEHVGRRRDGADHAVAGAADRRGSQRRWRPAWWRRSGGR